MLVTAHIKERGRLPRLSAAATIVSDLQGAAAGPSLISERNGRRQCHFCMDRIRRVCSTCCKCGSFTWKVHSLSICSPCST
ncbi:Zinc metalloproteinase nas-9 [Dissostichus eleginoides]|uniref:Zinc metalloproteinase nas-9 n=1 Tax=Dissostichus eleginoides TaxID=100907 RepID=A0AAD9F6X0_DISEL|nr:Zinc metalloproteinase nas-9 [Dissostichus eleginoides]